MPIKDTSWSNSSSETFDIRFITVGVILRVIQGVFAFIIQDDEASYWMYTNGGACHAYY